MNQAMILLGPVSAFMSSVTWALGSTEYARLSRQYSAFSVNLSRAVLALPCFFLASLLTSMIANGSAFAGFSDLGLQHLGWFTLSMISSYAVGDVLFLWSTQSLGVPAALSIASTYPLMTTIGGVWFKGETLSWIRVLGLLITIVAVIAVILTTPKAAETASGETKTKKTLILGVLFAVGSSIFWALNTYAVAQGGHGVSAGAANTLRMIIACCLCFTLGRLMAPKSAPMIPASELRASFWIFLIETVGGSYFFMYGLGHTSLAIGSTLVALAPAVAVPIAWVVGSEKFSLGRTFSICSVLFGIWVLMGGLG